MYYNQFITYESHTWSTETPLSAKWLNELAAQYDACIGVVDSHNHDDEYYKKASSDAKFFSTSFHTGFDADLLDGYHANEVIGDSWPIGAVILWSGSEATIPAGWHPADGTKYGDITTPDTRDAFIIGAGGSYSVGATGGAVSCNPSGTFETASHILTVDEMPVHSHDYHEYHNPSAGRLTQSSSPSIYWQEAQYGGNCDYAGEGHGHTHTGTATISPLSTYPPYMSLFYICKTS